MAGRMTGALRARITGSLGRAQGQVATSSDRTSHSNVCPVSPPSPRHQGELSKTKPTSLKLSWSPELVAMASEPSDPSEPSGHNPTTNLRNQNSLEQTDTERKSIFIFHFSSPPALWIQRNNYNHMKELKLP